MILNLYKQMYVFLYKKTAKTLSVYFYNPTKKQPLKIEELFKLYKKTNLKSFISAAPKKRCQQVKHVYSAMAPSTNTVTLLFRTSTNPLWIEYFSISFLSFKIFRLPLPKALTNGACLSRISNKPLIPGNCTPYTSPLYNFFSGVNISRIINYPFAASIIFLPFSIASSKVPTRLKAASGYSSTSPSMMALKPLMVSSMLTNTPFKQVN